MAVAPNYIFYAKTAENFINHAEYLNSFSPPECEALVKMGLEIPAVDAGITDANIEDTKIRSSKIRWIECRDENVWLWHKLGEIVNKANDQFYHFELLGFKECIQFTEYSPPGDHYAFHMDYGPGRMSIRKLSITIPLSDPSDYEGGDLELFYRAEPTIPLQERGKAIIFPSYTMHRVTPVTEGTRYSLVVWISGHSTYR